MRIRSSIAIILFFIALGAAFDAQADIIVDFEDPLLGFRGVQILDPYESNGVSFTAQPFPGNIPLDEVVGLVFNSETSACVEPKNDDVKLGTGRELSPIIGAIGRDGFPIKATLVNAITPNKSLGDQVEVSADFQTVVGSEVRMRLFNAAGEEVAEDFATVTRSQGDCGYLGSLRGTVRLTIVTQEQVSYAILDIPKNVLGGISYVVDNFQVRFVLGPRPEPVFPSNLCDHVDSSGTKSCEVISLTPEGDGIFSGYINHGMSVQVVSGRNLCDVVGGCPPCPIEQFICQTYEFIFKDVIDTDLDFTKVFTLTVQDLEGNVIGQQKWLPGGELSISFTRPTQTSSGLESNFILVLRPAPGLPWKFGFRSSARLEIDDPEPLRRFDLDHSLRIEDDEFFMLMQEWINGFLPDQVFFQGLDHWMHQLPLAARAASVAQKLNVTATLKNSRLAFKANMAGVAAMHLELFDTSGRLISSQHANGSALSLNLNAISGHELANGVYFYRMTAFLQNGTINTSEIKKLYILR